MPPSLSLCSYIQRLRFLSRVRRFLLSKSSRNRFRLPSDDPSDIPREQSIIIRNYDAAASSAVLQRTVKSLHFGDGDEKQRAAKEIETLIKESAKVRKLIVDLGVIPALVAMADSDPFAVRALIQLANHTFLNKTLIVEEGILSKLPNKNNPHFTKMDSSSHEFPELLFSLSCLANTQLFLASTEPVVSYLLTVLNNSESIPKTKTFCLATLFSISTILENAETLISNGVVPTLLRFSCIKEFSEKALPTLANLAVTSKGKQALENNSTFPEILIEILTWEEKPKCQELSAYIIMIMAHQSWAQRERLAKSSIIVSALLGLALLGSPLAQKRALKLLQWFKDERQARVGAHSGPQMAGIVEVGSGFSEKEIEKGKRMMRSLVKQSLHKNMEIITRRANAGECSSPRIRRTLVSTTSSKSLPF